MTGSPLDLILERIERKLDTLEQCIAEVRRMLDTRVPGGAAARKVRVVSPSRAAIEDAKKGFGKMPKGRRL